LAQALKAINDFGNMRQALLHFFAVWSRRVQFLLIDGQLR